MVRPALVAQAATACSSCTDGAKRWFHSCSLKYLWNGGDSRFCNWFRYCSSSCKCGGFNANTRRSFCSAGYAPMRCALPSRTAIGVCLSETLVCAARCCAETRLHSRTMLAARCLRRVRVNGKTCAERRARRQGRILFLRKLGRRCAHGSIPWLQECECYFNPPRRRRM